MDSRVLGIGKGMVDGYSSVSGASPAEAPSNSAMLFSEGLCELKVMKHQVWIRTSFFLFPVFSFEILFQRLLLASSHSCLKGMEAKKRIPLNHVNTSEMVTLGALASVRFHACY